MVQIIFNDRRYDGWQRLCIGQGHYGRRLAYVNKLVKQDLPEMLIEKSVICYKKKVVIKLWDQLRAEGRSTWPSGGKKTCDMAQVEMDNIKCESHAV